jgi:hypothetical protein
LVVFRANRFFGKGVSIILKMAESASDQNPAATEQVSENSDTTATENISKETDEITSGIENL